MENEVIETITDETLAAVEKLNKNLSTEQVIIRTAIAAVTSMALTYGVPALVKKVQERRQQKAAEKSETPNT